MNYRNNILETIGRTPIVRLNKLAPAGVNVHVKVESFNPLGSVKDRLANVERIVTDSGFHLTHEIDRLRGNGEKVQ